MATITLTIPDEHLPRVRAALCAYAGMTDSNANAKAALVSHVKEIVRITERNAAIEAQPAILEPVVDDVVA